MKTLNYGTGVGSKGLTDSVARATYIRFSNSFAYTAIRKTRAVVLTQLLLRVRRVLGFKWFLLSCIRQAGRLVGWHLEEQFPTPI